jgi:hypothetical protein
VRVDDAAVVRADHAGERAVEARRAAYRDASGSFLPRRAS